MQDYDGSRMIDADGQEVGKVERTFVNGSGAIQFVEVRSGSIFPKHRLVPADSAELVDEGLRVPFTKELIEESPNASGVEDTLTAELLADVRAYYANAGNLDSGAETSAIGDPVNAGAVPATEESSPARTMEEPVAETPAPTRQNRASDLIIDSPEALNSVGPAASSDIRDLGDVIEIPIVEERLVKQPVVTEVIRVRKSSLLEQSTVAGEIRREDIEVEHEDRRSNT